ncbi:hypothetical protein K443DRAFT_682770 [Laccaria amethystina LaAM-08-1]|jgi:hypothetical protein|uniref:Unplaced genomic scaffold K443scaffold_209, whole genome shotgun sequence n=1 Tax=Laccaria amethystina LaAM-08-1 TaxID=1095629 RepID=A0A0C9XDE1_9AGAR|nr:hypothetical protein K443DRAFT_682770 [Laccaria amethystina LaAM-08-1]
MRACDISAEYINDTVYLTLEDIHSTDHLISVIPTLSNRFVNFTICPELNDNVVVNWPRISVRGAEGIVEESDSGSCCAWIWDGSSL